MNGELHSAYLDFCREIANLKILSQDYKNTRIYRHRTLSISVWPLGPTRPYLGDRLQLQVLFAGSSGGGGVGHPRHRCCCCCCCCGGPGSVCQLSGERLILNRHLLHMGPQPVQLILTEGAARVTEIINSVTDELQYRQLGYNIVDTGAEDR